MEALAYTGVAVVLYAFADWLLQQAEIRAGRRFELRTLYFFVLLLGLALATFWLIRRLFA